MLLIGDVNRRLRFCIDKTEVFIFCRRWGTMDPDLADEEVNSGREGESLL